MLSFATHPQRTARLLMRIRKSQKTVRLMTTHAPDKVFQIDVFIDLKSPHSYLMVKPALQVAEDYECLVRTILITLSMT